MGTFIAAYSIVWFVFAFYIIRLRSHQRRLEQLARTLECRLQASAEMGSRVDMGA